MGAPGRDGVRAAGGRGLGPATYFADLAVPRGERHVRVCTATACFAARGRPARRGEAGETLGVTAGHVDDEGRTSLQAVHGLDYRYAAPAALGPPPVRGCRRGRPARRTYGTPCARRPRLRHHRISRPPRGAGNEESARDVWRDALARLSPDEAREEAAASGPRGRGGAGSPVAAEWAAVADRTGAVVGDGDEGDPGSYADRLLTEKDPGRVLAGLALACYACGALRGTVLVRSEHPEAAARIGRTVLEAVADGDLSSSAEEAGQRPFVEIVEGAGSYAAGEETALIARLEGARGVARPRPPYPTDHGLWDAPTGVDNAETLAAVPWIVRHGGAACARRGTEEETGTKPVRLSERFARSRACEVELGAPVREIVTRYAAGSGLNPVRTGPRVRGPAGISRAAPRRRGPGCGAARHGRRCRCARPSPNGAYADPRPPGRRRKRSARVRGRPIRSPRRRW
ncbi:hypothetical protein ACVW0K_000268 [Streptomyces filamentosus]